MTPVDNVTSSSVVHNDTTEHYIIVLHQTQISVKNEMTFESDNNSDIIMQCINIMFNSLE